MNAKKILLRFTIITLVITSVFFILSEIVETAQKQEADGKTFPGWLQSVLMEPYLPGIHRMNRGAEDPIPGDIKNRWLLTEYPVFLYMMETADEDEFAAESDYARLMMLEGSDEDNKTIAEEDLEYEDDAMHLEQGLADALLAENGMYLENQTVQEEGEEEEGQEQISDNTPEGFVPVQNKSYSYHWEDLLAYEDLVKAFYAVDSTTKAGEELLDVEKLLARDMRIESSSDDPQILIYHTHAQEAFADSVPGDESTSIVGIGEYLASILEERYGYRVMHYTESFDKESRDYAYGNALPVIEQLLADHPDIEVVIDLHRDAMPEDRRLVMELQGRPTAQIMFFNGLSRTAKGEIAYLENPYLADNLAFSFQMQAACNEYYPGLARRIYLKAYRYNMHLCPKTLLIELGAQNNTVEEMRNACEPLAHVLDLVLSGEEPKG